MSLFSGITIILILLVTSGIGKPTQENYEQEWYPIKTRVCDVPDIKEWLFQPPKDFARFIKDLKDCYHEAEEIKRLHDLNYNIILVTPVNDVTSEMDPSVDKKGLSFHLDRRGWNVRPMTEIGPGAFKSDIQNSPPGALGKELKKLLALKKRQEDRAKDLNEGHEN